MLCLLVASVFLGCTTDLPSTGSDASGQPVDANTLDSDGNSNSLDGDINTPDAARVAECSADALELISLLNAYRGENGLPAIPASPSLCIVGDAHVVDLNDNSPDAPANCNLHSWSDQDTWSPCCYTADHAQAQCMWSKPSELTVYPSRGYENAAGGGGTISSSQALNLWKNSAGHNAIILNQDIWANLTWNAIGVGIQDGYAVMWFGESLDPANN